MIIRPVLPSDAKELLAIYAPYVADTTITFEYDIPSISEFTNRIKNISKSFPYLVAEENGKVVGYAYDWTCELSIYLDKDARSKKIGSQLYDTLEKELVSQGYVNLLACISLPNDISIAFHKKRGFNQVAHFPKIGFKFEQWHDIVWLQKRLKS